MYKAQRKDLLHCQLSALFGLFPNLISLAHSSFEIRKTTIDRRQEGESGPFPPSAAAVELTSALRN